MNEENLLKDAQEECLAWLDRLVETTCFPRGEMMNIKKFRMELANGTLKGHEGRYVLVSQGSLYSKSYTDGELFSFDKNCDLSNGDALIMRVPDTIFITSQVLKLAPHDPVSLVSMFL